MRVTNQDPTNSARRPENPVRSNEVARTKSPEGVDNSSESSEVTASDRVELSSQARDIQRAREAAQAAPEVRADKVEAARRALQSGNLNLNGKDLADKIVQDTLPS